ncbi:MAG: helix-hairpin-helix domain-containing protein [Bacteroidota bacterium]
MGFLDTLQQKVGFTRREAIAILTLSTTFVIGLGIRWFQSTQTQAQPHEQFDYSKSDSAYAARAQAVQQLSQHSSTPPQTVSSTTTPQKITTTSRPALVKRTIDINTATKSQLMGLPGIGGSFAERIIAYRNAKGSFTSVDQLTYVKGIGEKTMEKLRPFVVVK